MVNRIKYVKVDLRADKVFCARDAEKIRGYIGQKFIEDINIHNHADNGYIYRYPLVQYKVVEDIPVLIGLQSGVNSVWQVFQEVDYLALGYKTCRLLDKSMIAAEVDFGISANLIRYEFKTPWYALNQENFLRYTDTTLASERNALLARILIGNILSMAKSLGVFIGPEIQVADLFLSPRRFRLDDVRILGFLGAFSTNFHVPDYLGIGKSVSRGFGTIKKVDN